MKRDRKKRYVLTAAAVMVTLIHIIPLVTIVLNSFRSNQDINLSMLGFPKGLDLHNYLVAWEKGGYASAYANSLLIGAGTAFAELFVIGFAVYGIQKTNCYFKKFFSTYFVAGLAIPSFAILVPLFSFYNSAGLLNTRVGMVIIYVATNMSFNYMFLSAFFEGMSREMDEAARIDGATEMQNFIYNVMPVAKPIFTSIILITFVNTWNEFLFSNTFLQEKTMRTVSLRFYNFVGSTSVEYGYVYAAAIISILPVVVIYMFTQDKFIEGMTVGSVKG
ncbi:MAG: carbohydrate ABC transporter permease [Eubacteriales bacterium]|nr:carbohydrate ABC transporter permease [Eubacteriales bacterium]